MKTLLRVGPLLLSTVILGCGDPGESAASTSAPLEGKRAPLASARTPATCDPTHAWVELNDGATTHRFSLGRELIPGARGSTSAFAELVVHKGSMRVFHLEALGVGPAGGLLTLSGTMDSTGTSPRIFGTRVETVRPGAPGQRDELVGTGHELTLDRFDPIGGVVAGSLGPLEVRSRAGETATITVRFRVCRTPDWTVRL